LLGAATLGLGALCATAAIALAAHPVGGGHYKGHIQNSPVNTKIKFKVSQNGQEVRALKTKADPVFFGEGCDEVTPDVEQESDPAHISHKGKFRGVITYTYPGFPDDPAKAVVKGKFHRHGHESGKVIATFPNEACNGTAHYSTKAQ
jgi:hypothetical protein